MDAFLFRLSRAITLICYCITIYLIILFYPFYLIVLPILFVCFFNWLIFGKITHWIENKNDKSF